jgi:hypothetical protein
MYNSPKREYESILMIKVVIPSNNIKEREYLLDILFNQFLNIPYKIVLSHEITDYQIYIEDKLIVIKDAFFSIYPNSLEYLHIDSIPKEVSYFSHSLFVEENLPILFGKNKIEINKNSIVSHIDIFATIFFMLTRWEEYVDLSRDEHNRFPHTASLAYKHNFLDRPIVNEYVEFIWNMFLELGYSRERAERKFSILLTHDVDEILRYPNLKKVITGMGGDVLFRKSIFLPFKTLYDYTLVSIKKRKDPYNYFDEIMDISDSFNIKSHFFFMSGGVTKYDNRYNISNPLVKEIIDNIKKRGHYIGLHPSYNAYNNIEQFRVEKEALKKVANEPIDSGREHYLRFEVPHTWQIWEDNGFKWCSNLAYPKLAGFRSGCCYPYTPFNILSRTQLTIKERPLIMMEVTFVEEAKSIKRFNKMVDYYLDIIKKYNGEFVLLWHNASFKEESIKPYAPSYKRAIQRYRELV